MSIRSRIASRLLAVADRRPPDFVIGGHDDPYLRRWWIIRRNGVFNIYLHHFLRSDDDRALHDHPYLFNMSWLLRGGYVEQTPSGRTPRAEGAMKLRFGPAVHRIELLGVPSDVQPCWTLFISGPRYREWGFYCPKGWRHHEVFTSPSDKGQVGRGCE